MHQITLHDEVKEILHERGNTWMPADEIAEQVNSRGRYRKRDGSKVSASQIVARINNYPHMGGSQNRLIPAFIG